MTADRLLDMMRHALHGGTGREYRNRYCCEVGSEAYLGWKLLVGLHLAEEGRTINEGRDAYFHVSGLGKVYLGLVDVVPERDRKIVRLRRLVRSAAEVVRAADKDAEYDELVEALFEAADTEAVK